VRHWLRHYLELMFGQKENDNVLKIIENSNANEIKGKLNCVVARN